MLEVNLTVIVVRLLPHSLQSSISKSVLIHRILKHQTCSLDVYTSKRNNLELSVNERLVEDFLSDLL